MMVAQLLQVSASLRPYLILSMVVTYTTRAKKKSRIFLFCVACARNELRLYMLLYCVVLLLYNINQLWFELNHG